MVIEKSEHKITVRQMHPEFRLQAVIHSFIHIHLIKKPERNLASEIQNKEKYRFLFTLN